MQELADVSMRHMESLQLGFMNEAAKQQFEIYVHTSPGKPMTAAVAATISLIECSLTAWYWGFMALLNRLRKHRNPDGIHITLRTSAQTTKKARCCYPPSPDGCVLQGCCVAKLERNLIYTTSP
jgi:hypothetical protein